MPPANSRNAAAPAKIARAGEQTGQVDTQATTVVEVADLTADEARALVGRIRQTGAVLWQQLVKAYQGRAWIALGYSSWDELCDTEFRDFQLRLPREERREVVASLRDSGMSTRAIASATGSGKTTIIRDLSGGPNGPPDPDDEVVVGAEVLDDTPLAPVIGIDGKRYKPSPRDPSKPRRNPLPQQANAAGYQLRKAVQHVERIYSDDRFEANRERVARRTRGDLEYAVEVCQALLAELAEATR